ncbi:MAG: Uma2 family endonuclease [Campylobacterota bacterium]|nr:Uma2 family endonuclease [Campylobacterota bacterium]
MGALEYYTYHDYKHWEGSWELIDGEALAMAPSPMKSHQQIAYEIARILGNSIEECEQCTVLGEEDYIVDESTILKPDIVLMCNDNDDDFITKAPEIVIEVISKSTARRDEEYKFKIYEKEKVKYYILVYPDSLHAKIFKLYGHTYQKEGDLFDKEYIFEDLECSASLDFKKAFKKFKK